MMLSAAGHVAYCILGVAFLLSQSETLFNAMKYVAAAYLCYLGVQSLRAKRAPNDTEKDRGVVVMHPARAYWIGFLTNGLNPKATLFFLALFTVVIDINTPTNIQVIYGLYLATATFAWFALLSLILGRAKVREFLQRAGLWFERAMGFLLIFLAIQIVVFA